MSQIQLPQAILSTDADVLIEGIMLAAVRGINVFVTASIKESFDKLFKEFGIELKEYQGVLPDTCVLIREHQQRIIVEVYDGGKKVNAVSMTPKRFIKVLETYLRKRKGDVQQLYFELIIPKDFVKLINSLEQRKEEGADEE